jgi:hypothetical protein
MTFSIGGKRSPFLFLEFFERMASGGLHEKDEEKMFFARALLEEKMGETMKRFFRPNQSSNHHLIIMTFVCKNPQKKSTTASAERLSVKPLEC